MTNQSDLKPDETNSKPGVFIKTFGCQMNEYDSRKLAKILEEGYQEVSSVDKAELIVLNTCSVREKPEHKVYSLLGEVRQLKEKNPNVLIGIGGCVAQQEGSHLTKKGSGVDFVFGTHNLSLVPSLVQLRKQGAPPQVAVNYRDEWEELPLGFTDNDYRVSAYISVSRGCNKRCAFCIVPTTRGPEVSRSLDEIMREARIAVHRGAKEIVLLGQTVNSYGLDLNPRMKFVDLLRQVADIDGVERIRFTSPHPQEVRSDFIDLVCENPKICPHIHMPLQAGSDRILKLMNRNYRRKRYLSIIEELKSRVPHIGITTDIIVGFPGETREEFEETLEVMEQVRFQNSYSFIFSPRPGTIAEKMEDPIPGETKLTWLKELQALQESHTSDILNSWEGREVEVLLEGPSTHNPDIFTGRTPQNISMNLSRPVPNLSPGMTVIVRVSSIKRFTLEGEYICHSSSTNSGGRVEPNEGKIVNGN